MNKIVMASTHKSAGKTGVIIGLARALKANLGYLKPFGDRLLYQKKRLWDYDSALITNIFRLNELPEEITIGFEHSKVKFMFDEESLKQKLNTILSDIGTKDILIAEGGHDLFYGSSINLDSLSLAKYLDAKLILVVSGSEGVIADDILFVKKYIDLAGVKVGGVIINQVQDMEDFKATYLPDIENIGLKILGILPFESELRGRSVEYISRTLFAKILTGENKMQNRVKNILIGSMSANEVVRSPVFNKEKKLVITSGDRTDIILACLETDTAAIFLTNNLLPPSNVISRVEEKEIPMLLLTGDTFAVAKQVDDLEPLITKEETDKIDLLTNLVEKNIDINAIAG